MADKIAILINTPKELMTDNSIPGPMTMIKVDGAKIKHLREEQGLTQLYLATAVQVTTDTISRWENRRYPSIKKENGLKLAEALNVELDELLEEQIPETEPSPHVAPAQEPLPDAAGASKVRFKKVWPFLLLTLMFLYILAIFAWYSFYSSPDITITAERIIPEHCIAGQPFPVIIRISGAPDDKTTAIIIRESLPANATVLKISPENTGGSVKNDMIKWLSKISGRSTFAYVMRVTGKENEIIKFSGTADISGDTVSAPAIGGDNTTTIGHYHWADSDKDNVISDSEILTVHDRYNEIEGIDRYIDAIEEIWLGSGYRWKDTAKSLEILD